MEKTMTEKPKIAVYWASSCGGCEIALVNLHHKLLEVADKFDIMFCPAIMDVKYQEIKDLADKDIAITFFNGSIRNSENEEMAHLLRKKSQILIAYGSCAYEGCIPGMANFTTKSDLLKNVYLDNLSNDNPEKKLPVMEFKTDEGTLVIPSLMESVRTLNEVVDVDYFIPGCPPEPKQIWNIFESLIKGEPLPALKSILGSTNTSVCEECKRIKEEKKIKKFYRIYEIIPDEQKCLLEQGLICMGIATRGGCGALCPKANMPCIGCYGPPDGVLDQGGKMIAALGSILDIGDIKNIDEKEIFKRTNEIIGSIPDLAGTFYKFSQPHSLLNKIKFPSKKQDNKKTEVKP
jgi:F420-non-reducing hydrogenase small subunit